MKNSSVSNCTLRLSKRRAEIPPILATSEQVPTAWFLQHHQMLHGDVWFSCKLRILLRHLLEEAFRHTCPDHFTSCLKLHRFEEKDSQRLSLLSRASDGHCSRPNLGHLLASYPCRSCLRGGTSVSYSLPPST